VSITNEGLKEFSESQLQNVGKQDSSNWTKLP